MTNYDSDPQKSEAKRHPDCPFPCCADDNPNIDISAIPKPLPHHPKNCLCTKCFTMDRYKDIMHRGLKTVQRGDFVCGAAGFGIECKGTRCRAHIVTRKISYLKSSPENLITVCKAHESWFNLQPLHVWYNYVKENHPIKWKNIAGEVKFVYEQLIPFIDVEEGGELVWIKGKSDQKTSKKLAFSWGKFYNFFARIAISVPLPKRLAAANSVKQ